MLVNRFASVNGHGRMIREGLPGNAWKTREAVIEAWRTIAETLPSRLSDNMRCILDYERIRQMNGDRTGKDSWLKILSSLQLRPISLPD